MKKKILELVDIVKYFITELEENKEEARIIVDNQAFTQVVKEKAVVEEKVGSYFIVEFSDSTIAVMQNSVDEKHVVGTIGKVVISNRSGEQEMVIEENDFRDKDQFEDCQGLDDNNEDFVSFEQDKKEEIDTSKIYINIQDVDIYDQTDTQLADPIISSNIIGLEIIPTKDLRIGLDIKRLEGSLNQDQYTFIMRMLD